jgi:hypothetical protein
MELLIDPTVLGALKIVGGVIAIVMAVPFLIGLVLGWMLGRAT